MGSFDDFAEGNPFKIGDKVIHKTQKDAKAYKIRKIDDAGWCGKWHHSQLELWEIYNSPLAKALREDGNND